MAIDIETGKVFVAGREIKPKEEIEKAEERVRNEVLRFVPLAQQRIKEAAILRLRLEHNMSFAEIGKHPDVRLSEKGVIAAFYRVINPYIDPDDIQRHRENALKRLDFLGDEAISVLAQFRGGKSGFVRAEAIKAALKVEDRRAKLLGIDAPRTVRVSGGSSILGLLAGSEAIDPETLKEIQALDPVVKPKADYEEGIVLDDDEEEDKMEMHEDAPSPSPSDNIVDQAARAAEEYIRNNAAIAAENENGAAPRRKGVFKIGAGSS